MTTLQKKPKKWWDTSLPCRALCDRPLHRFHLSCLGCLDRRYHYNKIDKDLYVPVKKGEPFMMVVATQPMTLPVNMKSYSLIINNNGGPLKRLLKHYVLKPLLSIAELLANW